MCRPRVEVTVSAALCFLTVREGKSVWATAIPLPAMDAPDLYHIPGGKLDKFIEDNLQPDGNFQFHVRKAVNIICEFLRENCFKDSTRPQARVLKVVKVSAVCVGVCVCGGEGAGVEKDDVDG